MTPAELEWVELAKKMLAALPDVLAVRAFVERAVVVEVAIVGARYDDAQMNRLLGAEIAFLDHHPSCGLSFRYLPMPETPETPA